MRCTPEEKIRVEDISQGTVFDFIEFDNLIFTSLYFL